uniref:Uncharacterized protein n=1 Tax=Anguilla anguilla TaxID=7936 RepID=A0A0E9VJ42_ANGAN
MYEKHRWGLPRPPSLPILHCCCSTEADGCSPFFKATPAGDELTPGISRSSHHAFCFSSFRM